MSVVRVALPGVDVKQARVWETAIDNLYPNPKIDTAPTPPHAGIIDVNWTRTAAVPDDTTILIHSFPHGYGYTPTVFASHETEGISTGTLPFQLAALAVITIDADEENINLKYYSIDNSGSAITPFVMHVRYYIMAERGYE